MRVCHCLTRYTIHSDGLGLVWASDFEVHADQIVGLADEVERVDAAA